MIHRNISVLFLIYLGLFSCIPPTFSSNPCEDPKYLKIKVKSYDEVLESEYQYFLKMKEECSAYNNKRLEQKTANELKAIKQELKEVDKQLEIAKTKKKTKNRYYERKQHSDLWKKAALEVLNILDEHNSSSSASSNFGIKPKGCHVFGNIKFVDFGEDYRIKFVDIGENLKVKYSKMGFGNGVGNWHIVDFGEDYRIKIVEIGEDFEVKIVEIGEGCN